MLGCSQIGLVSEHPTQDNPRKKCLEIEGEKKRTVHQAASGYPFAKAKTSRTQTALKGETKTVIDMEKDVGCRLLDRLHLVKVHKFADKLQCKRRKNQPKE